jgi:hypothetical protein
MSDKIAAKKGLKPLGIFRGFVTRRDNRVEWIMSEPVALSSFKRMLQTEDGGG